MSPGRHNIVTLFFFSLTFLSSVLQDRIWKTDKPYSTSMQVPENRGKVETKYGSISPVGK